MSSDRFESLISQIPAATLFFDVEARRFTYASQQVEQLLGVTADVLLADAAAWRTATHPADRSRVLARYEEAIDGGSVFDETYRIVTPTGLLRWVRNFMVPADPGSTIWKAMLFDVTAQAQAQAERELLIEQLPAAVIRYDMDEGRLVYASPQLEHLLGLPVADWMAPGGLQRFADGVVQGQAPTPDWRERAERGETWTNKIQWRRPDGRLIWLRVTSAPTLDRPTLLQAVLQDATDEIAARSEHDQLIDQMPAAVMRLDVNRRTILYASPQVEALTGEPPEAWLGPEGYARWSDRMVDAAQPDWEDLGRQGMAWTNQYRWARADGVERVLRSVIHVVATGVAQAVVFDATAEVETERRLAAEQRRYQTLVEQLPMVIIRNAVDGEMEYVSPQVEGMLGYTPEEFIEIANSDRWEEVIHSDDRARLHTSIAALSSDQISSDEFELRLLTSNGGYRNVLFRRSRVDPPDGRWYLQGIGVDITDLREAEARSRSAVAALVRGGEDQQARIAIELHDDTVQVMTAILFQLERTLDVGDPARQTLVDMLRAVIERTRRLMFELRPQLLEKEGLQAMLVEMVKDGPWEAAEVDVQISRQSDTLEALLYRTLRELILNARKHSQAGKLSVTGRERSSRLTFHVTDDGIGFAFETALSQHPPGLHLGLTTVIERVRLAGGDVAIESNPGAGTRFTIRLPAEPRTAVPPSPASAG